MTAVDSLRWLRFGGLAAWLGVGVPLWLQRDQIRPDALPGWFAAWLLFALALWVTTSHRAWNRRAVLPLLAVQAICVLALVLQLCDGFEGTLLVVVAMQRAPRLSRRAGLAWIAVQTLLLAAEALPVRWSHFHSANGVHSSPLIPRRIERSRLPSLARTKREQDGAYTFPLSSGASVRSSFAVTGGGGDGDVMG